MSFVFLVYIIKFQLALVQGRAGERPLALDLLWRVRFLVHAVSLRWTTLVLVLTTSAQSQPDWIGMVIV